MFSLIVFDLDGTLVDSLADLAVAVNQLVSEFGGSRLSEDAVGGMVGEGASVLVSRAIAASGARVEASAAVPRYLSIYDSLLPGQTRPYPGIPEVLETAARAAKLAVLTNKPTGATRKILDALVLTRYFFQIVGADDTIARKPDPAGLRHLMSLAGAPGAATLLVGDSTVDVLTAREAETCMCVARYGFGQLTFDPSRLTGRELFIDRPAQLLDLLRLPAGLRVPHAD